MSNNSYLITSNLSSLNEAVNKDNDFILSISEHSIPILWLACFDPKSIKREVIETEDGKFESASPYSSIKNSLIRLNEIEDNLKLIYNDLFDISPYINVFKDYLISLPNTYIGIHFLEVSYMIDHKIFESQVKKICFYFKNVDTTNRVSVRKAINDVSGFNEEYNVPNWNIFINTNSSPTDEEISNHSALLGSKYLESLPWED